MYQPLSGEDFLIKMSVNQPFLSQEKELELIKKWKQFHDRKSLNCLISSYARLSISIAKRYRHYNLPLNDLSQEGMLGLIHAAERFDPLKKVRFSTYARWWVRSTIQEYLLKNWSIVRTATTSAQKKLFFNFNRLRDKIKKSSTFLTEKEEQHIADVLNLSLRDVRYMGARLEKADQSLNAPLRQDSSSEWQDFLDDPKPTPEEEFSENEVKKKRSASLKEALEKLNFREQKIIKARHLSEDKVTLEELGKDFHVSKERIRQIENVAMSKLQKNFSKEK